MHTALAAQTRTTRRRDTCCDAAPYRLSAFTRTGRWVDGADIDEKPYLPVMGFTMCSSPARSESTNT
jgi:hypothetical protein